MPRPDVPGYADKLEGTSKYSVPAAAGCASRILRFRSAHKAEVFQCFALNLLCHWAFALVLPKMRCAGSRGRYHCGYALLSLPFVSIRNSSGYATVTIMSFVLSRALSAACSPGLTASPQNGYAAASATKLNN